MTPIMFAQVDCGQMLPYLCYQGVSSSSNSTGDVDERAVRPLTSSPGADYFFVNLSLTQPAARNVCQTYFTDLANLIDISLTEILKSPLNVSAWTFWIGATQVQDGQWVWTDGGAVDAAIWLSGVVGNQSCATFSSGRWSGTSCGDAFPFLCYKGSPTLLYIAPFATVAATRQTD
ncbi:C-type lectin domain family 12 member B-like [Polypterus senegalus]|uniref:C-type lectin domain family 12 member B-like n=1 Tax=Polypterus senegalus TaxID=55291 RepID=UPI001962FF16|nr:C-type lectin domain family 12 member B-like [Polypterus senegalus]